MSFDFDPLDLRSHKVESVSTLLDLAKDPETSPNTIDVLAPSQADANKLADRLSALPEVGQVLTLSSFIPKDQNAKLAVIRDASFLMDAALNPFVQKPPPTDAEVVASFRTTAKALRDAAGTATTGAAQDAVRLAGVLEKLANADPKARAAGRYRARSGPSDHARRVAGLDAGRARDAQIDAARSRARLDRAGWHGAHPGVPEGQQQRQRRR